MAPDNTHTVFGFDCGLDWRPTVFVNGISSNRVCSVCDLVPSKTALLPCRHVLCQPCYDRCVANAAKCCLDGEEILSGDVIWSTLSVVRLLERQIQCWNASAGCNVSGPASQVLEHFRKACQHHTVPCPRCKRHIAHKDVVSHCQWGLCIYIPIVDRGNTKNVTSGIAQITNSLTNLDTKVTSLQSSLQEDLRRIANSVEVSSERMSQCLPVLESIHVLDNTVKESMQLSGQVVAEISDAQNVLLNNTSAIMGSLQMVLGIVSELRASRNQTAGERSMTVVDEARHKQASDTLAEEDATSGRESSNMLFSQNGTCVEEPRKFFGLQNGTSGEKPSEALPLKQQKNTSAEEEKSTLSPENCVCGEERSRTVMPLPQMCRELLGNALQDRSCGKESSETLGPQMCCKKASETLAPLNQTCTVEASRTASLLKERGTVSHQRNGSVVRNQARLSYRHPRYAVRSRARHVFSIPVPKSQVRLLYHRYRAKSQVPPVNPTCTVETSQTIALPPPTITGESNETSTLQDQDCNKDPTEALVLQIQLPGERPRQAFTSFEMCGKESSKTSSPESQIHEHSQKCGGGSSDSLVCKKQPCNVESSITSLPQDQIQDQGTVFASQDQVCGKESSETLPSSKEPSNTSDTPNLIVVQEPGESLAGVNGTSSKESDKSEHLYAYVNLKHQVDKLASTSAAERSEIKEKLKAVEKMIQDCVRTGSMNQSNVELFRREFRDKMRSLGPVSKWSFNNKLNVSKTLSWTVESWSDAKAQSRALGSTTIYPEAPDYFYGYRILPSAVFETRNRFQSVTMGFQICRGTHDGLVLWPMRKTMCLMLVNPVDRSRGESVVLNTADLNGEEYDRPGDDDNSARVCTEKVSVRKLEGRGCIHNNKLELQFYIMA